MRLIDADALINDAMDRYCKDCDKRKGIKSGKWRIIYEIGDAPCRACDVDDMVNDIESAPTVEPIKVGDVCKECWRDGGNAVEVVRCKDCVHCSENGGEDCPVEKHYPIQMYGFCHFGERRSE